MSWVRTTSTNCAKSCVYYFQRFGTITWAGANISIVLVLGGALTVSRQTNHNLIQPDTVELDRSASHWTESSLEQQLIHWESEYPDAGDTGTSTNFEPDYFDDGTVYEFEDQHDYYDGAADEDFVEPARSEPRPLPKLADRLDEFVIGLMGKLTLPVARIGLAIIFFWFGALKFFDGMSPAQGLVEDTVIEVGSLFGFESMPSGQILFLLAFWEVAIGVGLLLNRYRRTFLLMLFLQLPGTILPVFLLPSVVWHTFPYGLTLEGQYIVKNLVLVGAALALGSQIRYDEQRANQADLDWVDDIEEDEEDWDTFTDAVEPDYWDEDTLHLTPIRRFAYDTGDIARDVYGAEPEHQPISDPHHSGWIDANNDNHNHAQEYDEPGYDHWYDSEGPQSSHRRQNIPQGQESYNSFWAADPTQLH